MENTKKREVREGEDDEDEMKMEKFYALLRSFRDARDRRRRELEKEKHESRHSWKKMKTTAATTKDNKSQVSFEFQDFTTEIHFRKPPLTFANPVASCDTSIKDDNKGKKKEQQDLALDLKLAL
ncbi:hypothetical protein AAZX31_10G010100 [Glycine max]|uniref:Uncharacterized protein n=2 Tax=Glycine subgen. Soja TaxID=1462606 RepID=C6SZA2_SOYBN|nr:putative NIM1-interacting family protein [Glycine max]XP_028183238.1 protein NIM1-INTERACTING 1-like [Glycine soja]ACU14575.1 unknown [Glycine max]KAG4981713.1 hypothetical protein JHK87_026462 [Glycine soja]KAG4995754.1 hypothetical protein JHK85_027193 [Glycine max]KAG5002560.1 hypothetical protein JHK86_026699 [Glycine max]KAG5125740.1 hypothetical protein JHK82_026575 [Glycine max]|eukprot:NP_001238481.1 putative NIM1-interacting family protein [Glycine max]